MANNFQQLEEQELRQSRGPSTNVYEGIMGGMRSMQFVGGLFDHFIPKMMRFFVSILGGDTSGVNPSKVSHHLTDSEPEHDATGRSDYPNLQP